MALDTDIRARIESLLEQHPIVLFMKGSPQAPMCGFSAATSSVLTDLVPEYHSVDVLADPAIREGIKAFGEWPTIPQLYVKGELIGGADIIRSMYASGELHTVLGVPAPDRTPPEITVTDTAAAAIRDGMGEAEGAVLHLQIDGQQQAGFSLAPATEHDIVCRANGLDIHLDPGSAQRAKGIVIDWVETVQGAGLSLSFPGSTTVKPMTVQALQARIADGGITLIDVRPADERAIASITAATALEDAGESTLASLPKDTAIAFLCHSGNRSQIVAGRFAAHGFTEVYNIEGGIDAWSREIDSSVPRY